MLIAPSLDSVQPAVLPPPKARPMRRSLAWVLPLALVALLYLGASGGPALFDQNEAQYAGAVREMMNRPQDYLPATRDGWSAATGTSRPTTAFPGSRNRRSFIGF